MNAVLLDFTHPLLEQGLEQGGIGLWRGTNWPQRSFHRIILPRKYWSFDRVFP